jgi:mevalonate pyrophosphate decarboxylase
MALEVIDGRVCCLREKLGDEWVKAHSGDITLTSEEAKAAGEKWVAATNAANFDSRYRGWYDAMLEGFGLAKTQMALQRQIRELTKNMGPDTLEYHLITIGSTPPFGTQQR